MHSASFVSAAVLLVGQVACDSALQYLVYDARRSSAPSWKIQPRRSASLRHTRRWWLPALHLNSYKERVRHPRHAAVATTNILQAALICFFVVEASLRQRTNMVFGRVGLAALALQFLVACAQQSCVEYVWHRALHTPFLYRHVHKLHHYYKAPEPFDAMVFNPVEGAGYYLILFSPALWAPVPVHAYAFVLYMIMHGAFGVLDHCGIDVDLFIYDTRFHDRHHSHFTCNYGFPFSILDRVFGTLQK